MEYTQLVNRILDAEHSAREIAQEVHKREESLESELTKEKADLRASFMDRADKKIAEITHETQASRDESLHAQDVRRDEAMARMERAYQRYGDNWADTLFHRIVGDHS